MRDLTQSQRRILAYINDCLGRDYHPGNAEIGEDVGVPPTVVRDDLHFLIAQRHLGRTGRGATRKFGPPKALVEPVRVERWTCNRCGGANVGEGACVNCNRSGRGYLSTSARLASHPGGAA